MRLAAIGLSIALLLPVYAHSQEPAPRLPEPAEPKQEETTADDKAAQPHQKKPDPTPIVVNVLPAQKTDHEADEDRKERKEKADLDRRLVDLTADLAWFTAALFAATAALVVATGALAYYAFRQSRDMKESLKITKVASDAAVAAERARFFIAINDYNISDILLVFAGQRDRIVRMVGQSTQPAISYSLRNYGKTPGIIKEVSFSMQISSEPVDPVYSVTISAFPEYMIASGSATEAAWAVHDFPLDPSQADAMYRNHAHLWFFGRIDYEDVFGGHQCHRFYFRTVMWEGKCILQPYDYKHYNEST